MGTARARVCCLLGAEEGGSVLSNGSVHLRIKDGGAAPTPEHGPKAAASQPAPLLGSAEWVGPLGRHDDGRSPYFKLGMCASIIGF